MFKQLTKKRASGFTIIEVMIVLAIAGLIMVVVLVAVPQLQRSQRNSASTAVLDRVFTELNNYASNNNGEFPNSAAELNTFCTRYLGKTTDCANASGAAFINDPRTGTQMRLVWSTAAAPATDTAVAAAQYTVLPTDGTPRSITVFSQPTGSGFRCEGENVEGANGARQIAAVIPLEGGAFACRDNQ